MAGHKGDRAEEVALFRFSVIAEAVSARLTPAERGLIVRQLAGRSWTTPEGTERSLSRVTIDRWIAAYRRDGLSGLRPVPRSDTGRSHLQQAAFLEEAARLRRQLPARSSVQIADAIFRAHGVKLSERTVRAHLARAGLSRKVLSGPDIAARQVGGLGRGLPLPRRPANRARSVAEGPGVRPECTRGTARLSSIALRARLRPEWGASVWWRRFRRSAGVFAGARERR